MTDTLRVYVVPPSRKQPAHVLVIPNKLKALQEIVGGYIETVTLANGIIIVCNEEGRLMGLPANERIDDFVGTVFMIRNGGDDFASLTDRDIAEFERYIP